MLDLFEHLNLQFISITLSKTIRSIFKRPSRHTMTVAGESLVVQKHTIKLSAQTLLGSSFLKILFEGPVELKILQVDLSRTSEHLLQSTGPCNGPCMALPMTLQVNNSPSLCIDEALPVDGRASELDGRASKTREKDTRQRLHRLVRNPPK